MAADGGGEGGVAEEVAVKGETLEPVVPAHRPGLRGGSSMGRRGGRLWRDEMPYGLAT